MHRVTLVVRGRVQGVGFRWFVRQEAERRTLHGTVANRRDGAVVIEAEGPRPALEALVAAVWRGPTGARVGEVDVSWNEGPGRYGDFRIAPSS